MIAVFEQPWSFDADGEKSKNYYVRESVGIAVGILLVALHTSGLATLSHAPSPMGFLKEILGRPENERPFLLIPVGYPTPDAEVPALEKKTLEEIADFVEHLQGHGKSLVPSSWLQSSRSCTSSCRAGCRRGFRWSLPRGGLGWSSHSFCWHS